MTDDHPLRRQLQDELHERASLYFDAPATVWHDAFLIGGDAGQIPLALGTLNARTTRDGKSGIARTARGQLKWELHTEFVSLTHVVQHDAGRASPLAPDADWHAAVQAMPGERISAVEVVAVNIGDRQPLDFFETSVDIVALSVGGGDAEIWSPFRLGDDGRNRFCCQIEISMHID